MMSYLQFVLIIVYFGCRCQGIAIPVKYVGCMMEEGADEHNPNDTSKRGAFKRKVLIEERVNINNCVYECFALRFKMAAMQRGELCYCAMHKRGLIGLSDEFCYERCHGNCRQRCGGLVTMSVYKTARLNCYPFKELASVCKNQDKKPLLRSPRMTPQLCSLYCFSGPSNMRYPVAVLEDVDLCCCCASHKAAERTSLRNDRRCFVPCRGAPYHWFFDRSQCVGPYGGRRKKYFTAFSVSVAVIYKLRNMPLSTFQVDKSGWLAPFFPDKEELELKDGIIQYNLDRRVTKRKQPQSESQVKAKKRDTRFVEDRRTDRTRKAFSRTVDWGKQGKRLTSADNGEHRDRQVFEDSEEHKTRQISPDHGEYGTGQASVDHGEQGNGLIIVGPKEQDYGQVLAGCKDHTNGHLFEAPGGSGNDSILADYKENTNTTRQLLPDAEADRYRQAVENLETIITPHVKEFLRSKNRRAIHKSNIHQTMPELLGQVDKMAESEETEEERQRPVQPIIEPENTGVRVVDIPQTEEDEGSIATTVIALLACMLFLAGVTLVLFRKRHAVGRKTQLDIVHHHGPALMSQVQGKRKQSGLTSGRGKVDKEVMVDVLRPNTDTSTTPASTDEEGVTPDEDAATPLL